ncbi:hypothetical protein ACFHWD_03315 [Clostridium sp. MT-14]|uniref:hypothetical protein n=1 Tax=Clostridium sp. MT-14 TaxID=3348360 RepID=UPI0035F356CC
MSNSVFFNNEDIVESSDYKDAVDIGAFLQKIENLCSYEQDYTYNQVVDLEKAEEILCAIRLIMKK